MHEPITMNTPEGQAEATHQPTRAHPEDWMISTPWGDQRFSGTPEQVVREMRRIVRLNTRKGN